MGSTGLLIALLGVTWLAGGLAVALVMRRSGHDLGLWLAIGLVLGPVAAVFARERHGLDRARPYRSGGLHSGSFDAVAGIDGSDESISAVQTALKLFGDRLTSLTLATALDYEASGAYSGIATQSQAHAALVDVASRLGFEPIDVLLLYGQPADAMAETAQEGGYELIILGARGIGMSEALFGSVTASLIGRSPVPIFVGPQVSADTTVSSLEDSARSSTRPPGTTGLPPLSA